MLGYKHRLGAGRTRAHGKKLRLASGLETLDLRPLPGLPLRDLDVGRSLQALDLGIGRGGLPGDFNLRLSRTACPTSISPARRRPA